MLFRSPIEHDASSTRWCLECKISVGLSFAGEKNWTKHTESAAHQANARKAAAVPTKKISSFFTKIVMPTPSSSASTSALIPTHLNPKLLIHQPLRPAPDDLHPINFGEALNTSTTLLNRFKGAINSLPLAVPVGINSTIWLHFQGILHGLLRCGECNLVVSDCMLLFRKSTQ